MVLPGTTRPFSLQAIHLPQHDCLHPSIGTTDALESVTAMPARDLLRPDAYDLFQVRCI